MVGTERRGTVSKPPTSSKVASVTLAVMLILGSLYAFCGFRVLQLTGGRLVYALDDAYIHMAIAKNLALHSVWGVEADRFSASSSSPLWTLLLSGWFCLFGVSDLAPIVLNTAFLALCVVLTGYVLSREGMSQSWTFAVLLTTALLGPLVPLVWLGMEHVLHIVLTVVTVSQVALLTRDYTGRRLAAVSVLAALAVAARYEGLFVVAGCVLLLVSRRRVSAALTVASASLVPVVSVGAWNVANGWFFFPASILMKQTVVGDPKSSLVSAVVDNVMHTGAPAAFFALLVAAACLVAWQARSGDATAIHPQLFVFTVAAMCHLAFAKFGYLWRYESYLMVLGTLALAIAVFDELRASGSRETRAQGEVLAIALMVLVVFSNRSLASNVVVSNTAGHIYRQHLQVTRFLSRYYDGQWVAMNDIGAVSYYTQVHVEDLMGLGSLEMARLRRAGTWDASHLNQLLSQRDVKIAVIYQSWFQDDREFQRSWYRVGDWVTDIEEQPAEGTVTFFAANAQAAESLQRALREFNPTLPRGINAHLVESRP